MTDLPPLGPDEISRYRRHLSLPEFGETGQRRLKSAHVLLVGAGGLGSPVALYLAAAGIGHLVIVDFDEVDATNLQRQILYGTDDVGRSKLEAARQRLSAINPHVEVRLVEEPFGVANARALVEAADIVVDGTDNFATRYLVNDACVMTGTPNVYGSISRFEGQASVFAAAGGPCYRCLHPEPPPPGLIQNCADGGVLGVLPGVIGTIQATEAIKLVTGIGEPLVGRLLLYDALRMRFREISLPRDEACPVCGETPSIRELIDVGQACESVAGDELTAEDLRRWREEGRPHALIDVREAYEHAMARIDGAELIPLAELPRQIARVPKDLPVVVHCHSGVRSASAVAMLRRHGIDARNLIGGILAWDRACRAISARG
jgi:sulfur-carrier protein adenylyltransferase/sulfurtransferase